MRVVPASELHAETLGSDHATPAESRDEPTESGAEFDIVGDNGEVIMRSNRLTVDDPSRQTLSMEEIEELKKAGAGSGKDIIAKIMASHQAIDEKTSFSLAKYTLRKSRKYLKRFTVLPLDIGLLIDYITEREAYKIMELREETLGLLCSWANVHCGASSRVMTTEDGISQIGGGRWLVVDDTGGLVVAAMAEKMDILYPNEEEQEGSEEEQEQAQQSTSEPATTKDSEQDMTMTGEEGQPTNDTIEEAKENPEYKEANTPIDPSQPTSATGEQTSDPPTRPRKPPRPHIPQMSASTNTLTLLHNNSQPNLANLKYFSFDSGNPSPTHPLYTHLKSLSWLQLLAPHEDPSYVEPEIIPETELAAMKSSKRGNYYKKRRRWERASRVIDETQRGGFDGLVVASVMEPRSILKELVPLVRGGGRVVVYSPNVEPLVELCDLYSKERRTAYVARQFSSSQKIATPKEAGNGDVDMDWEEREDGDGDDDEDFPLNPTLLLAPVLQTARARQWQVLPGRTHPMMTSKGGAEGYLFTATRVLPAEGKVEARGHGRGKKRKTGVDTATPK